MVFELFLSGLERRQIVARLNEIVVGVDLGRVDIFAVWKGEVGVEQYHDHYHREEGDTTKQVGQEEACPSPHFCTSLVREKSIGKRLHSAHEDGPRFYTLLHFKHAWNASQDET